MSDATHALTDQLATLFGPGTCAGMTDGELLERFRTSRDEAGERAFEALVTRHGPMVLGICRKILDDPSDVHDAFQAVFLVLARRAATIRKSESVGSWLHGVAVRVCARARAASIRRRVRDRRILAAAATAAGDPVANPDLSVEHDDGARVVHEEVVRLPESYRAPIVLCYLEGLTHDEAAARLRWPVGTVRSRLARARDRLRTRLARRGVSAPSSIGPIAAWLTGGPSPSTAAIRAAMAADLSANVPAPLARAAVRLAAREAPAVGAWSSASIAMADGVLTTMTLKKLALAGCLVLTLGTGAGTGIVMTHRAGAQAPPAPTGGNPAHPQEASAQAGDPLVDRLLAAARQRVESQGTAYKEGRITLDRFIDACVQLEQAEVRAAADEPGRVAARRKLVDTLAKLLQREQEEMLVGRSSSANVAELAQRFEQALLELKSPRRSIDDYEQNAIRLVNAAEERLKIQTAYYKEGRITIDRLANASRQLSEAEQRVAKSDAERVASRKRHLDRLKEIEAREEAELKAGWSTQADMTEATTRRIEAELDLRDALTHKGAVDLTPILRRLDELEQKVEQLRKEQDGRR